MLLKFRIIYFILYIYTLKIYVESVNINNKEEFIESINKKDEILDIKDTIIIDNDDIINVTSKKILISGNSNNSVLNFTNNSLTHLLFHEKCVTIEIKNLNIIGNLKFNSNKNIIFNNVIYNGYFLSKNTNLNEKNNTLQILNSEFRLSNRFNGYEIYNYNLDINLSKFYGNDQYNLNIMNYFNEKEIQRNLSINGTLFSGNFHNAGLYGIYSDVTITNTKFEKFYSGRLLKKLL